MKEEIKEKIIEKEKLLIGDVLRNRIKLIGENEQTYTGYPSDLIDELFDLFAQEREKWAKEILKIVEEQLAEILDWTDNIGEEMKKLKENLKTAGRNRRFPI